MGRSPYLAQQANYRGASRGKSKRGSGHRPGRITRISGCPLDVPKAVADLSDGLDEGVVSIFDLAAQAPDVHVDRVGAAEVVVSPNPAKERLPREDPTRI